MGRGGGIAAVSPHMMLAQEQRGVWRQALQPHTSRVKGSTIPDASMPQKAGEDLWGASQQPWEHANQGFPKLSKAYFGKNSDMAGTMGCNHGGAAAFKTACWSHQGGGGIQQVPPGLHGWILPFSIASYVWDGGKKGVKSGCG